MKYFLIAGEASGDLHGANLVKAVKEKDAGAVFHCWGGHRMEKAGAEVLKHYREMAFMGFWEVITNLSTILKYFKECKQQIQAFQPDAVVLIDYPGFNLRMAKFAKEKGYKVFYYISPQVWAWHQSRVKQIKKYVDHMLVILPFEQKFYLKHSYKVDFVGHPLLDEIGSRQANPDFFKENDIDKEKPLIAILPGSRRQEISKMLPVMAKVADSFPDHQFAIAGVSTIEKEFYTRYNNQSTCKIVYDQTYDLLESAEAAMVTSGTATLEAALFEVPQVVCYKGNWLSYFIGKTFVDIDYISLVNLIAGKEVVKELVQNDFNEDNLQKELAAILNRQQREKIIAEYKTIKEKLGGAGASEKAASLIHNYLTV